MYKDKFLKENYSPLYVHACLQGASVVSYRPNLYLSVGRKSGDILADLRKLMVQKGQSYQFEGPTIIYCLTKKVTETVNERVKGYYGYSGISVVDSAGHLKNTLLALL